MRQTQQDYGFKILSSLALNIIRSPPTPFDFSDETPVVHRRRRSAPSFQQITPAGFASMMLGMSLTLMLSGSLTFFIGFFMMPWVLVLVMFLYVGGVVSTIGRAFLCCNSSSSPPNSPPLPHGSICEAVFSVGC